jgi:hypothetical protein
MLDASSADPTAPAATVNAPRDGATRVFDLPARTRIAMVAFGLIPFIHLAVTLAPVALAAAGRVGWNAAWVSLVLLFVLPPVAVRATTLCRALPAGQVESDSSAFLHWWFTAQWQVLFTRLPFLEECLRLVPGLYSTWLRLWGARIGSLVYWSPGVVILDRPVVRIGSRVVFGVGVRLNPHVLAAGPRGRVTLHLAPIVIGDDVLVGGYSLLLPGAVVAAGEATPPFRSVHAYSRFEGGRRVPERAVPSEEATG